MTSREKVGRWPSWASPNKWVKILFEGELILSCNYIFTRYCNIKIGIPFQIVFQPILLTKPPLFCRTIQSSSFFQHIG